jgi:hypothetical protein
MAIVVSNTAPLIALTDIGHLELLRRLFEVVTIPHAVRSEVVSEPGNSALKSAIDSGWIRVQAVADALAVQLLRETLDEGESEAIVLAQEVKAQWVILDDLAARNRAQSLNLPIVGTLGILLMAKDAGYLSAVKPLLHDLGRANFRMSDVLFEQVLRDSGESE